MKFYTLEEFESFPYLQKYLSKKVLAKYENSIFLFGVLERYKSLYNLRIKTKVERIRSNK